MIKSLNVKSLSLTVMAIWAVASGCATQVEAIDCLENPDLGICQPTTVNGNTNPARIYVDPPFGASFSCVLLGCNETRMMTIENRGGVVLGISRIELESDAPHDFGMALFEIDELGNQNEVLMPTFDNPLLIETGASAQLMVQYIPADGTEDVATLMIDWFNGNKAFEDTVVETLDLNISGRFLGDATGMLVSEELNFGYTEAGAEKTLEVELLNTSDTDVILSLLSATLSDDSSETFSIDPGFTGFVNPGETIKIPVTYRPGLNEASFGTLVIEANDDNGIYEIPLMGTAIETAFLNVTHPTGYAVDFGQVEFSSLRSRTITLRNDGGTPTTYEALVTAGAEQGFSLVLPEEQMLGALESVEIGVDLMATQGGSLSGSMAIEAGMDDEGNRPEAITLSLLADCSAPVATPDHSTLSFPELVEGWTSTPTPVSITNTGSGTLIVSSIEFDMGSSDQFQLASGLNLPAMLNPGDVLEIPVLLTALSLGDTLGALLVNSNSIDGGVLRVELVGSVVTCEQGCPVANGTPSCFSGTCEILDCNSGWHDTDTSAPTGCECQEDRGGSDIGQVCSTRYDLGTLGDGCSDYPSQKTMEGTLHSADDMDLFFMRTEDTWGAFCDTFGDSARTSVELQSGPPGLVLCAVIRDVDTGCGGYTNTFDPSVCGQGKYEHDGSYGSEDARDLTAWVMWHPDASPSCGTYTLKFRGED
jgi:hypothetical protein